MAQDRVPPVADRISALTEVARTLQDAGIGVQDIGLRRPTLDEVLLHLTGRPAVSETLTAATSGTVPPHDHPPGYRRPRRLASAVSTGRSPAAGPWTAATSPT